MNEKSHYIEAMKLILIAVGLFVCPKVSSQPCQAFGTATGICQDTTISCNGFYGTQGECPGPSNVSPSYFYQLTNIPDTMLRTRTMRQGIQSI